MGREILRGPVRYSVRPGGTVTTVENFMPHLASTW